MRYKECEKEVTFSEDDEELVFVRVDRNISELFNVKPESRWDAEFFHPKYDFIGETLRKHHTVKTIGELLNEPIIAPDHVRASLDEKIGPKYNVEYRTLKDLMFTGLNYAHINYCSNNAYQRLKRTQLKVNDILFAGSGVGAIGRVGIVEKVSGKSCVGDLFIIRDTQLNQHYLYVFLLTIYGQMQIEKIFHGVQSAKISTEEIEFIEVPVLPVITQKHIESEYKKMFAIHFRAMACRIAETEKDYEKNIAKASAFLKELIEKTEGVIKGERRDVI